MKVKLNLSLDSWIKRDLEKQANNNSRNMSEHVKELVISEEKRINRRGKKRC